MPTQVIDRVAVDLDGSGEPVVLLHGLGGTSNTWTPLLPAFARLRTVRPDLPGSGRSHRVEGPLSIARMAGAVSRICAELGIEGAHFVGHSMGCIVSFALAVQQPRLVRSLALFGPLLAPPDPARAAIRTRGERARVEGMQPVADGLVQASLSRDTRERNPLAVAFVRESLMRQEPDAYARSCEALAAAEPIDPARIACPILLVTGDEDTVAPPQAVRSLADRIRGARQVVFPRCGHWTPIERAAECTRALLDFHAALSRQPNPRGAHGQRTVH